MQAVEIFIKAPTQFMNEHWPSLLPEGIAIPQSLVLILLRAQHSLDEEGILIEKEKDRLFSEFLKISESFRQESQGLGYPTTIISPKDGYPLDSPAGSLRFDSVAAVQDRLNFPYDRTQQGCKLLTHPQWQRAVYPGLLLSAAPAPVLDPLLPRVLSRVTGE
jgi:hypothetical protein